MLDFIKKNNLSKVTWITIVLSCIGFGLLELNLVPYGFTLFCIMPMLIGYHLAQYPTLKITLFLGAFLGIVTFFFLLFISGLESIFCIITLSPLLLLLLFAGMFIGYLFSSKKNDQNTQLNAYVLPILVLLFSNLIEKFFTEKYTEVQVESKITVPFSKEMVFDKVKSFDTLNSEKPFFFKIGIQTPLKCVLEKDSVGAKRTCYFKEGRIDEVVTDFKRGEILKMEITNYNMAGRKWLHFQEAIYLFKPKGDSTELTRITTYKTELKPRWYWGFWEEKAIKAEHEYVLNDLKRRLKNQ